MKAHRYFAILVFILSAAWVLTGEFSFVGSAVSQDGEQETVASREKAKVAERGEMLQSVGYAIIPTFEHSRTVNISGVTKADKSTVITARTNGIIGELLVRKGDKVNEGDIIARLDPEGRDAVVRSAEQLVVQREAEVEAQQTLVKRGTLPRLQLDQTMSALRTAESQLEQARAEIEKLEIAAPYGGIIDDLPVEDGSAVNMGTPVATLISLDPIIGVGEVNESDLPVVKTGGKAELRLVNNDIVEGTIRFISREAQASTRTYTVEVEVENTDLAIPAGMTTEVILRGDPVIAMPVPRSIVTLSEKGELGVRTIDDENKVVFHPIDIVDDSADALLLGGIPEGSRVIVAGQNLVSDGQKVDPVEADPELVKRLISEVRAGIEGQ